MPPKAKFEKEEIINAALQIVCEQGISALTARGLGARLQSSARPIFTVFNDMNELRREVIRAAKEKYKDYIKKGLSQSLSFRGVGEQYILFAIKQPKLFALLFMNEQKQIPSLQSVLEIIDENYLEILSAVRNDYGLDDVQSRRLYQHMWIYTHGIATLCATDMCRFTQQETEEMLGQVCRSLIKTIKAGDSSDRN